METFEIRSTSSRTAECNPIVLRQTEQVRLVFIPTLVDNPAHPNANVRGKFVYQKKGKADQWLPFETESLSKLKKGEGYQLDLHLDEVFSLRQQLHALSQLQREQGVPRGKQTFLRLREKAGLIRFLQLGQVELDALFEENPSEAIDGLLKIVRWIAGSSGSAKVTDRLSSVSQADLPDISSLLALASTKSALRIWESSKSHADEQFWQDLLSQHVSVLSQLFAYPVVVIKEKAYLGGRTFEGRGGKEVDFLASAAATGALLIIEIKTPMTKLLGSAYRTGVKPLSPELNGAVAQALHYRQRLIQDFEKVTRGTRDEYSLGSVRCIVLAGDVSAQLGDAELRNSFELLRHNAGGVEIVAFDELFARARHSIGLLEGPSQTVG